MNPFKYIGIWFIAWVFWCFCFCYGMWKHSSGSNTGLGVDHYLLFNWLQAPVRGGGPDPSCIKGNGRRVWGSFGSAGCFDLLLDFQPQHNSVVATQLWKMERVAKPSLPTTVWSGSGRSQLWNNLSLRAQKQKIRCGCVSEKGMYLRVVTQYSR